MLKIVLFSLCLGVSIPLHSEQVVHRDRTKLINYISDKYSLSSLKIESIVAKVTGLVDAKFPRKTDVLAIIEIESNFKSKAVSSAGAKGLMQVLYKKTTTDKDNIIAGVALLREYRKRLGSEEAAIHAYNVGIGNYNKGRRVSQYYNKYVKAKKGINAHII